MCDNLSHLVKLLPRVLGIRQHLRNDEIAIAERCFDLTGNVISPLRKKGFGLGEGFADSPVNEFDRLSSHWGVCWGE